VLERNTARQQGELSGGVLHVDNSGLADPFAGRTMAGTIRTRQQGELSGGVLHVDNSGLADPFAGRTMAGTIRTDPCLPTEF